MPQLPMLPERYKPLQMLGEGATGYVYQAHDSLLERDVAVKVVRPNLAKYALFRARFAREVALSALVIHPHLVPVHDHGRLFDGRPFVVMGYADQGSLGHLLRWGPPLSEVLRIVDQVLEALAALHARGLVHQDLKPANVLLQTGEAGKVNALVADLGVAGTFSELAMNRRGISGTPTWMAPEQLMNRPQELGPWTDLYALGRILYEILGGEHTPETIGRKALLELRMVAPPPLGENIPPAVSQVICHLLDPDPRQRYDRAADVRRALQTAVQQFAQQGAAAQTANPGAITFSSTMLQDGRDTISPPKRNVPQTKAVPRWNRVAPDAIPMKPPTISPDISAETSLALFALRDPPLVGQVEPMQFLWDQARMVVQRRQPRVVLVIGPPASGKSRVVHAVSEALEEGGYMESLVLRYHNPPGEEDGYRGAVRELLAPWHDTREQMVERLKRWIGRDNQVTPAQMDREANVLSRWCGYVNPGEQAVNAAVGLAYMYRYLDTHSWRGGACLVLEDAHLSHTAGDGLAICESLLDRSVGERPVLAMVTLSEEVLASDRSVANKVAALEERGAVRLTTTRMDQQHSQAMMTQALRFHPDLATELGRFCQGSPAIPTLLLRTWASLGMLVQGRDKFFRLKPNVRLEYALPPTLEALYSQRIKGGLATTDNPLAAAESLAAAALAGQEPPVSLIREVNPEGLDGLFACGLLRQSGWRLRFEHSGVHRAALRMANERSDLIALQRRLADAWEDLGKRTGLVVDFALGQHSLYAGESARAAPALLRASRTAMDEGRAEVALAAARLSINAADQFGDLSMRVAARRHAAEAQLELGRPRAARQMLKSARGLGALERISDARLNILIARAAIALGTSEEAFHALKDAAAVFSASRDREGLGDAAHGFGKVYQMEGRPTDAVESYQRMLELRQGHPRSQVYALTGLIDALISAGQLETLDEHSQNLRKIARLSGDTRNIAQATYSGGLVHLRLRRLQEAENHFHTSRALAATLGADRLQLACLNNIGETFRYRGDHENAERFYLQSVQFASGRSWKRMAAVAHLNLALLYFSAGAAHQTRTHVDQAAVMLDKYPQHWAWLFVGLMRALWAASARDEQVSRAWWSVAVERGVARLQHPDLVFPLARLSTVSRKNGWMDMVDEVESITERLLEKSEG